MLNLVYCRGIHINSSCWYQLCVNNWSLSVELPRGNFGQVQRIKHTCTVKLHTIWRQMCMHRHIKMDVACTVALIQWTATQNTFTFSMFVLHLPILLIISLSGYLNEGYSFGFRLIDIFLPSVDYYGTTTPKSTYSYRST